MATGAGSRGGFLYFVVGALVVAVGVLAYFLFQEKEDDASITIEVPKIEGSSE